MFTNWILHNIEFHIFGFNFKYFFAISVYSLNFTNIISYIVFHINYFIKIIFYSKAFQLKYSTPEACTAEKYKIQFGSDLRLNTFV